MRIYIYIYIYMNARDRERVILWIASSVEVMKKGVRDGQSNYCIYVCSVCVCGEG